MNKSKEFKKIGRRFLIGAIFLFIIACILPFSSAAPQVSVIVSDYKVSPAVLLPGEEGTLTITLKSIASGTTTSSVSYGLDVSQTTSSITPYIDSVILKSKDFDILGGDSKFEGNIGPDQAVPITFLIRAPQKSGMYFPEVWIRVRDGQSLKYPVPVNVNTQISVLRTPSLGLENTFPEPVKPGTKIEGTITISNEGSTQADNIRVFVNGTPPMAIPAGISSFMIDRLSSGMSKEKNLSILIDKNTPTGIIEIPVRMTYALLDGSIIEDAGSIGLDVRGESEISITSVETTPSRVKPGEPFDLIIRVQNTGTGEAKSVSATVDLPIQGAKEAFIGRIKSGNDAPATFVLEGTEAGEYSYHTTITYVDDWGTHTLDKDLVLTVANGEDSSGLMILILILLIAGAGGFYYMRRKNEDN
ncbi:LPXTG cell wall anchor domain-containing protein [Methanospirillum purgamenti]|uniref:LPXTG cell wall anchor domain-containing protein n=1 Tax=Methanospirillum hungatei TaxID=2203 RepID=A0A8F5VPF4_METHU|nr:LPXTG cell wall anchor domain-containing protein [Methanospirillum hungatei]QXO95210.1 LPXTG cell wall anchor domain-containing protein [Methanospirillum hungatei]